MLKVEADDKFDTGMFPELELGILKPEFNVLDGNWKIDTLVTDSLYFKQIWGEQCTGYELVPKFSSSDSFEISFEDASFQPTFRSGLKNFFNGDSQLSFGDEVQITDTEGNLKRLQMLSLDKTNRYFSETEVVLEEAQERGYDTSQLIWVDQTQNIDQARKDDQAMEPGLSENK